MFPEKRESSRCSRISRFKMIISLHESFGLQNVSVLLRNLFKKNDELGLSCLSRVKYVDGS